MIDDIENGIEFFMTEEDYLSAEDLSGAPSKKPPKKQSRSKLKLPGEVVKAERTSPPSISFASPPMPIMDSTLIKKRPRRSVASASKKYVVPDSDDEMIVDECDIDLHEANCFAKKRKVETSLQKWIKHLTAILHEEQKKVSVRMSSA